MFGDEALRLGSSLFQMLSDGVEVKLIDSKLGKPRCRIRIPFFRRFYISTQMTAFVPCRARDDSSDDFLPDQSEVFSVFTPLFSNGSAHLNLRDNRKRI